MTTSRIPQPPPSARFPIRYVDIVDTPTVVTLRPTRPRNSPEAFWYMLFAFAGLVVGAVLAMVLSGQWAWT